VSAIDSLLAITRALPGIDGVVEALRTLASRSGGGYVLAFHDISQGTFLEVIEALRPDEPVSLDDVVERLESGKSTRGLFAITIDDGYDTAVRSLSDAALARGYPLTFYLPIEFLDGTPMPSLIVRSLQTHLPHTDIQVGDSLLQLSDSVQRKRFFRDIISRMYTTCQHEYFPSVERLITSACDAGLVDRARLFNLPRAIPWEEVASLSRHPTLSFQSHGVTHQAVSALSDGQLQAEILESQRRIRECTGKSVDHFCYPYGGNESIGVRAPGIVGRYFRSGVTMVRGRADRADRALIPRIPIYEKDDRVRARVKTITT